MHLVSFATVHCKNRTLLQKWPAKETWNSGVLYPLTHWHTAAQIQAYLCCWLFVSFELLWWQFVVSNLQTGVIAFDVYRFCKVNNRYARVRVRERTNQLRWGWVFLQPTWNLNRFQFTKHFIEIVFVETTWFAATVEREIMLFIGKPMGRSIMISNRWW